MSKDFQRVKQRTDVKNHFLEFVARSPSRAVSFIKEFNISFLDCIYFFKQTAYLNRLRELRTVCSNSEFIRTHEVCSFDCSCRFFLSIDPFFFCSS